VLQRPTTIRLLPEPSGIVTYKFHNGRDTLRFTSDYKTAHMVTRRVRRRTSVHAFPRGTELMAKTGRSRW
jgi:hypothetical protein